MIQFRKLLPLYLLFAVLPAVAQVTGTLSGRVVDQFGAAVPVATVGVYMLGGKTPLLSGKTDAAGIFSFIAVQPDKYEVVVNAAGFAQRRIAEVHVDAVQETSLPSIKMEV